MLGNHATPKGHGNFGIIDVVSTNSFFSVFFFILHLLNNSLSAQKVERLYVFCILTDYYYIILTKQVGGSIVKHPQVADVLRKTPAFELHVWTSQNYRIKKDDRLSHTFFSAIEGWTNENFILLKKNQMSQPTPSTQSSNPVELEPFWGVRSLSENSLGAKACFSWPPSPPLAQLWTSSYALDLRRTCACFWKALSQTSSWNVWKVASNIWCLTQSRRWEGRYRGTGGKCVCGVSLFEPDEEKKKGVSGQRFQTIESLTGFLIVWN